MPIDCVRIRIAGAVQGVGFRPFVYRLAKDLGVRGWVINGVQGVEIEAEGDALSLEELLRRLEAERPPRASIRTREVSRCEPKGHAGFEIRHSDGSGAKTALLLPDIATCDDCLAEIFDPTNRRYRYPFTNCTNCGPRFSIIEALPYDRANTSMKSFRMCPACEVEYRDPEDRRFHAQPNACPDCGPRLQWLDAGGRLLSSGDGALSEAAHSIRAGRIVALKGIGGFQLIVDAANEAAVRRLRERKQREAKPFALMAPSLRCACDLSAASSEERALLESSQCPIVLIERHEERATVAPSVAPGSPLLGIMLPNSPLHHLLCRELGFAIVATSGNLSDEPICTDADEALIRLGGIADFFLTHDRPIVRHVDDSVTRVILGGEQILRRARGYAPLPMHSSRRMPCTLATGAHLKNTVALSVGTEVFISQHIGDLETAAAHEAFHQVCHDFQQLYDVRPEEIACDLHPEYLSTKFAATYEQPHLMVQHHYAHVLSCMFENELDAPVLGVSWDGTGYGPDGTIWGGEFLHVTGESFRRAAHLRTFRLPGGEAAIREPRRCALGVMFEILGERLFDDVDQAPLSQFDLRERSALAQVMTRAIHAPVTSSAGRLFDAVASLLGLRQRSAFEGQAAMELEFALAHGREDFYPFEFRGEDPLVVDWEPAIVAMLADVRRFESPGIVSAKFHNTLVEVILRVAHRVGESHVVLTGGCFQNRYLTERAARRLREENFVPHWHRQVPPNDGGIALGQIAAALRLHPSQEENDGCQDTPPTNLMAAR